MRGPAPIVVGSVLEAEPHAALAAIAAAPGACALVELRADRLDSGAVRDVVRAARRPLVVTVRRAVDGGEYEGTESARRGTLLGALDAGAAWIDVERGSALADLAAGEHRGRAILSDHALPCEIGALRAAHREMAATGAARLKLVPTARTVAELPAIRELLEGARSGAPVACFAAGPAGTATRLLAPSWGSWGTYGSIERGRETAAGQCTARDLSELYDVLGIGASTRKFALVGSRVARSPSPAMHRRAYRASGIDARCFPVETGSFDDFATLVAHPAGIDLAGFAVTMPFKERAAATCVSSDAVAEASGAANTVLVEPAGWRGFNTDGPAALAAIVARGDPRGKCVAVLGAGGTARAIAWCLGQAGARVTLYGRDRARLQRAAAAVGAGAAPWDASPEAPWDLLVNATPLGAAGEEALPERALRGSLVLDAAYGTEPTPLVRAAAARGLLVVDGPELLARQAALQLRILTGASVPHEPLEAEARRRLAGPERDFSRGT